jgi:hypothetical protein
MVKWTYLSHSLSIFTTRWCLSLTRLSPNPRWLWPIKLIKSWLCPSHASQSYPSWLTFNQVSAIASLFHCSWLCPSHVLLVDSLSLKLFAFFELCQLLIFNYIAHLLSLIWAIVFSKVLNLFISLFHLDICLLFPMWKILVSWPSIGHVLTQSFQDYCPYLGI